MIEEKPDGTLELSFDDWTEDMMNLSLAFKALPRKHGSHPRLHDFGIDRLSRIPFGHQAIALLYQCMDELTERPTDEEVMRLATVLMLATANIEQVRREIRLKRLVQRNAAYAAATPGARRPAPTRQYHFVRRTPLPDPVSRSVYRKRQANY